jgi:hypothetical protein
VKEAGVKFPFETNSVTAIGLGQCEYSLQVIDGCRLQTIDVWIPLAPKSNKPIGHKGNVLKKV